MITRFMIEGIASGGAYEVINDRRVHQFLEHFPNVRYCSRTRIARRWSYLYARPALGVERVLAIEARAANIEKAKFIGSLLGVSNV